MKKIVLSGLLVATTLTAASLLAGGTPLRVATSRGVATAMKSPRITPLPRVRIAPLSTRALALAKSQVARAFPGAASTASPTGPITVDASHWQASAGPIRAAFFVASAEATGSTSWSDPPVVVAGASTTLGVSYTGLRPGALYLLDCSAQVGDGTTLDVGVCWSSNPTGCFGGGFTPATPSVSGGHALFGFSANQSTATILVGGFPEQTPVTGCTLHPVS